MSHIDFELEGSPHIELHQLLKVTGMCGSGGMAKNLIGAGEVLVDGQVETRKRCKILPGQQVSFGGTTVSVGGSSDV
ncbi:MAG: RNA-binding S4 domain-containing protein [Desulfuromonadaceae bacterium]|nr:RNA-binding S4 domain-containing protein [Geobacteraceae bacterium]